MHVLKRLEEEFGKDSIESVISDRDKNVLEDYFEEIQSFCFEKSIPFFKRSEALKDSECYAFTVGWRYLILNHEKLIVFHDSLLPRYRGFNPLVTALINGDNEIGVTAIFANADYDCGDIIEQRRVLVEYPIKIFVAISKIKSLYSDIAVYIMKKIIDGHHIPGIRQDSAKATYSLWRDEIDYFINWDDDASKICRLIDATGFPYQGAQTYANGVRLVIHQAVVLPDLVIENRVAGKVIRLEEKSPVIVCGQGLLKITEAKFFESNTSLLPFTRIRTRFHSDLNAVRKY